MGGAHLKWWERKINVLPYWGSFRLGFAPGLTEESLGKNWRVILIPGKGLGILAGERGCGAFPVGLLMSRAFDLPHAVPWLQGLLGVELGCFKNTVSLWREARTLLRCPYPQLPAILLGWEDQQLRAMRKSIPGRRKTEHHWSHKPESVCFPGKGREGHTMRLER